MNSTKKIFITLALIVLLPAIFYSVYEISSLDETEEMLSQLYSRQLDAVLFSVNQYTLDVASGWASQIENELPARRFERILKTNPSIRSIIIADTALQSQEEYPTPQSTFSRTLLLHINAVDRLIRYQTLSYRKLEPVISSDSTFIILFVTAAPMKVVGIIVNNDRFIGDIIGRKLSEIAQNDLILNVSRLSSRSTVFSTAPSETFTAPQQRPLWIFPDHVVQIRLRGTTIQEAANERYIRNLVLIVLLDCILLAGAFFVYRQIKREMELVALRSDFVSNVSHELRTPLALIRMFAETLEMKRVKTEKKKQEYYGIILRETERLTRLINNILNFSRMESDSRRYVFAPADINTILSSTLAVHQYQLEMKGFVLESVYAKGLPSIPVDEEALAEAFHNLIDNAIKYSSEQKFLRLSTNVSGEHIIIEIEDHGIGIASEHQPKIFDKFYRVSQGLVHTAKGSGLGLSIVRHIIEAHRGTITLRSTPGSGTTFIIELPLKQPV
ncbi:MAG: GHKL domain-containing protein [Bacteroidetes bacterium]|nr:GHKL domain-containing protein [Bacteroidota bacterium]